MDTSLVDHEIIDFGIDATGNIFAIVKSREFSVLDWGSTEVYKEVIRKINHGKPGEKYKSLEEAVSCWSKYSGAILWTKEERNIWIHL